MGEPAPDSHPLDRLKRVLSLRDATLLVVSSVIGSGIFLTPGAIAGHLPEPGLIFLAWLVGGGLALAGALANAELGAMYPRAGGDYVYLREAFHPAAGFLVGWLSFFVIYAGTIATLAAGFSAGFSAAPPCFPPPCMRANASGESFLPPSALAAGFLAAGFLGLALAAGSFGSGFGTTLR